MLLAALVLVPLVLGLVALAVPVPRARPWLVVAGGVAHAALTAALMTRPQSSAFGGWLVLDPLGRVVLMPVSLLFLLCALYTPGYFAESPRRRNRAFCSAQLALLAMMSLVILSHHLGLMWVAMESSTLAAAPLLYIDLNPRSLEATWKYLLLGSVGIALALLGSFLLAYSALHAGLGSSLLFDDLVRVAPRLSRPWLHAGFVLLLVGYGTKVGLAPMHSWKPDAYGEAPGLAGALLSGGVVNCAFLAILRIVQICHAAGEGGFARDILLLIGLVSMAVAAAFMIRQRDFKRMLAYSSVKHVGILAFGIGVGGLGTFGALLHLVSNSMGKGLTFLAAGNLHRAYGSKLTDAVSGALRRVPVTGALFTIGFFAVTGAPPFGLFLSELTIVRAAFMQHRVVAVVLFLLSVAVVFIGMGDTVLRVVQGEPPAEERPSSYRDRAATVAPLFGFLALLLLLGVYLPPPFERLLRQAAALLERVS